MLDLSYIFFEEVVVAVIRATEKDVETLARLMRAEAEGEGKLGMLLAGNVGVNRVRYDCLDFINIRTVQQMCSRVLVVLKLPQNHILSACSPTRYSTCSTSYSRRAISSSRVFSMVFRTNRSMPSPVV